MGRPFEQATLADAVGRLRPGMRVLLAPGCGDPTALVAEILRQADRLAPLTLMGGLRLDDYPFGAPAYAGKIRFATWHMSTRLAAAAARGDVDFVPARYHDTVSLFVAGGPWAPDAVLVHTAPPFPHEKKSWFANGTQRPLAEQHPFAQLIAPHPLRFAQPLAVQRLRPEHEAHAAPPAPQRASD